MKLGEPNQVAHLIKKAPRTGALRESFSLRLKLRAVSSETREAWS
jgi:hypothetical protein